MKKLLLTLLLAAGLLSVPALLAQKAPQPPPNGHPGAFKPQQPSQPKPQPPQAKPQPPQVKPMPKPQPPQVKPMPKPQPPQVKPQPKPQPPQVKPQPKPQPPPPKPMPPQAKPMPPHDDHRPAPPPPEGHKPHHPRPRHPRPTSRDEFLNWRELRHNSHFLLSKLPEHLRIRLRPGETIKLRLEENATTGYSWITFDEPFDNCDVYISHKSAIRGLFGLIGAPGEAVVTLKATRPGLSVVELFNVRRWDWDRDGSAAHVIQVFVDVH